VCRLKSKRLAEIDDVAVLKLKTPGVFDDSFVENSDFSKGSMYAKAEREGQLRERIRFLSRTSLLIVDEIGYLPVIPGGGNLFFHLVNARYERGAMILTSNRGFAEWGEVFGDPVVAGSSAFGWATAAAGWCRDWRVDDGLGADVLPGTAASTAASQTPSHS
jgi:IstB-like ATP binding protein